MKLVEEAREVIRNSSPSSSIYIGCDSVRKKKKGIVKYSIVVIVHMDSKHGCKLLHETITQPDYGTMKQRLLNETYYAAGLALELLEDIGDRHLEIHLDINSKASEKSNVAVKEALGYCRGLGIETKIKPDAFAASHGADKITRH